MQWQSIMTLDNHYNAIQVRMTLHNNDMDDDVLIVPLLLLLLSIKNIAQVIAPKLQPRARSPQTTQRLRVMNGLRCCCCCGCPLFIISIFWPKEEANG
ncbi:hypothetical protein DERP_008805 [Dermatophagoides pteronyssinus]|uniref:Uncharacterized protein n=1 Tax=Dermatophagoides pteronyssinus TaxID=6956 RepID=A0ABQ8IWE0_DERPT|nr:hypothetical protein DERP_008805 [Dermatophagoides pteronyssinus]